MTTYRSGSFASAAAYATQGSLALQRQYPVKFTLIEGGHGDDAAKRIQDVEAKSPSDPARAESHIPARAFVVAVVTVLLALCLTFVASVVSAHAVDSAGSEEVVVQSGDTIWSLATKHSVSGVSTDDVVSWIEQHNAVDAGHLAVGQTLTVPGSAR